MIRRGTIIAAVLLTAACGRDTPPEQAGADETPAAVPRPQRPSPAPPAQPPRHDSLAQRIAAIDAAVGRWRNADEIAAAHAAAEEARNLIVGPAGPGYGDSDGDGTIAGAGAIGLLPGAGGEPGLATAAPSACVRNDVLGGDWSDQARRWAVLETAIANWQPGNNTFPALPSHPQRIVGWATLTLAATDLATARDYGRHAQIHADVSSKALTDCGA